METIQEVQGHSRTQNKNKLLKNIPRNPKLTRSPQRKPSFKLPLYEKIEQVESAKYSLYYSLTSFFLFSFSVFEYVHTRRHILHHTVAMITNCRCLFVQKYEETGIEV